MRHQRHPGATRGGEGNRWRVGRDQRAAGAAPRAPTYDSRSRRSVGSVKTVERFDDPPLNTAVVFAERRQRDDAARVVRVNVDDAPPDSADANVVSRADGPAGSLS
jgi:hypothetical protein